MDRTTIFLSVFWFIMGALASYLISRHFHKKSEKGLITQNQWLDDQLSKLSSELKSLNTKSKLALYAASGNGETQT